MKCRNPQCAEHHKTTSCFRMKKQEYSFAFITRSVSLFSTGAASCKRWIMRTQGTRGQAIVKAPNCIAQRRSRGGGGARSESGKDVEWHFTFKWHIWRRRLAPGFRAILKFSWMFFCVIAAEQRLGAVRGAELQSRLTCLLISWAVLCFFFFCFFANILVIVLILFA